MKTKYIKRKIITTIMALFMAFSMYIGIAPQAAFAASTTTVSVSGTYNYSKAKSVLTEVNNQRSKNGRSKLKMDKTLESQAMKRAAELSVYYSHTRPNGSNYKSAYSKLGTAWGENIAYGYSTASKVMNAWMNSSGHRQNILNKNYKSIGIGSFTNNGTTYWVQVFSNASPSSTSVSGTSNKTVSVSVKPSYISLSLTPASSSINIGKTTNVTAYLKNKGTSGCKTKINASSLKWSSGSTSVASVNSSGKVTGKKAGSARITAKTKSGSVSASTTISVKSATTSISSCSISLSKSSYTYDGTAKKPTVTVKKGSTTLKSGTNYTVSYSNNTNAGTAKVTITGKGDYTGSVTKSFTISKASLSSCTATLSQTSYTYDGTAKKPTVTVKKGSTTLKSGTDYSVSYSSNTNVGTAKATITGKGNYTGTITKTFTIKSSTSTSSTTTSSLSTPQFTSVTNPSSGKLKVKWGSVSNISGYELWYSTSSNFYTTGSYYTRQHNTLSDTTEYTFTGLTTGKTYYVRIRAYKISNGNTTYSSWGTVKSVKVS